MFQRPPTRRRKNQPLLLPKRPQFNPLSSQQTVHREVALLSKFGLPSVAACFPAPSESPTVEPSSAPSQEPSAWPTEQPTNQPTIGISLSLLSLSTRILLNIITQKLCKQHLSCPNNLA